ncbi:zinc transporter ZIP1-like [Protopterus annectens]|uniref:zinc transporter ZIP1-like n=1 Tax=Protopterus annectens TaxID=7888 RepID=UPI001CFAA579|nr:zinc transporter ZIP1-like [Protopterus annectens]
MDFPLPEFIMAAGFFLVLIIERIVLDCSEHSSAEKLPLLSPTNSSDPQNYSSSSHHQHNHSGHHHHSHSYCHSHSYSAEDVESGGHHIHVDFYAHSTFRSFILFLSLSFHSVFEGLAIGLQDSESKAVQICIAILIHKSIIVFSLALKLNQSKVRPNFMVDYIILFALMSPLGIAVGIGVMLTQGSGDGLAQCILEGIAAGTFVYITFLEILPHELNSSEQRLLSVLFVLIGFSIMVGLSFIA